MNLDLNSVKSFVSRLKYTIESNWKPLLGILIGAFLFCGIIGLLIPGVHTFSFALGGGLSATAVMLTIFNHQ